MYISSVEFKNFKRFEHLNFELKPGMNVIAGINGSGKTSILNGLSTGMSLFVHYASPNHSATLEVISAKQVHQKLVKINGLYRSESIYPVEIELKVNVDQSIYSVSSSLSIDGPNRSCLPSEDVQNKNINESLLIFAFYGATRFSSSSIQENISPDIQAETRSSALEHWNKAHLDVTKSLSWIVTKSTQRLQASSFTGSKFHDIKDDELAELVRALRLSFDEFQDIYYDWQAKEIIIEWQDEANKIRPTLYSSLSDGERTVISLYTDIVRRMCLLNPHLLGHIIEDTEGVILIDELDAHLHPDWQRKIVRGLTKSFPKIQFICTSHSPQILGEIPADQLLLLKNGQLSSPAQAFGLNSSDVLTHLMDAVDQNKEVKIQIGKIYKEINEGNFVEAKTLLNDLRQSLQGETTETAQIDALIAASEIFADDDMDKLP